MSVKYSTEGINNLDTLVEDAASAIAEYPEMSHEIIQGTVAWINEKYQPKEGPLDLTGAAALTGEGAVG
jgi:hypothetical protein